MIKLPIGFTKDRKEVLILAVVLSVVILVLYFYLLLLPQSMRLTDIFGKFCRTMSELKVADSDIAGMNDFKKKIDAYKEKVNYYERRLPAEHQIPSLLENLSSMAKNSGIKILGITPIQISAKEQAAQRAKVYKEIPIQVSAKSGYHELGTFLSNLERADRFMKVVDIEIRANKATPKKHDVELLILTYVLREEK